MAKTKTKLVALAATGALVAAMGLTACGTSTTSSSAASNSNASTSVSSAATNANSNASSSASSAATQKTADIVAWRGTLADGSLVSYISDDDGTKAALVIENEKAGSEKTWMGSVKTSADGKVTITDDTSKDAINFTLDGISGDGVAVIEVEGFGAGALVPLTADDIVELAVAEEAAKALGTYTNSIGMLDDGKIIFYTENEPETEGVVAIIDKDGKDMKVWSGKLTTAEDGTETVTDEQTKETFSYKWVENKDDGTLTIKSAEYGNGTLVKMTVGDWIAIDEVVKALRK